MLKVILERRRQSYGNFTIAFSLFYENNNFLDMLLNLTHNILNML